MTTPENIRVGGDRVPPSIPADPLDAVARIWTYRKRVEIEAADQFQRLADDLHASTGKTEAYEMSRAAAEDELRHAKLCEKILEDTGRATVSLKPELGVGLGPEGLSVRKRALYACVSLSCITETLSTALLVEMRPRAKPVVVREVVHSILEDEISHSRLGWAQLAREARAFEVGWLAPYLTGMIRAAVLTDVKPMVAGKNTADLSAFGILPAKEARAIMERTVTTVILPGLRQFGVAVDAAEAWARRELSFQN